MESNTVKSLMERAEGNGYVPKLVQGLYAQAPGWVNIPTYFLLPEFMAAVGWKQGLFKFLDSIIDDK